ADHFMDLQQFVARYGPLASNPRFRFDVPTDRLFVLVEKHPYRTENVAGQWSPSNGADAAWSVHRLAAGRDDLERRALQLCETYRSTHAGVSIAYDDADVRLYAIRL